MNLLYKEQADHLIQMGITRKMFQEVIDVCEVKKGPLGGTITFPGGNPLDHEPNQYDIISQKEAMQLLVNTTIKGQQAFNVFIQMSANQFDTFIKDFWLYQERKAMYQEGRKPQPGMRC